MRLLQYVHCLRLYKDASIWGGMQTWHERAYFGKISTCATRGVTLRVFAEQKDSRPAQPATGDDPPEGSGGMGEGGLNARTSTDSAAGEDLNSTSDRDLISDCESGCPFDISITYRKRGKEEDIPYEKKKRGR